MASTSEWRQAGSFFKHKGHNIFWREGGNPSGPVLLLKQFPAYLNRWDSQQARNEGVFAHWFSFYGGWDAEGLFS
jgi:hypothetical protein